MPRLWRRPSEQMDLRDLHEMLAEVTELDHEQRLEDDAYEPTSTQPASHLSAAD